ncbi:MAG: hypothetical protein CEE43_13710 [Promethearchaeota archaeon Loki_b32]|nr:MAG: hypothetical protein CEE43_13710 [Candidatus Lokiarchaeota archaeon Loki_b32]
MDLKSKEEIEKLIKYFKIDRDILEYIESLERNKDEILTKKNFIEKVNYFKALGDRVRFLIYNLIGKKEMCVCELTAILNLSQPAISHHIKILDQAGLIYGVKKGKFTSYEINKNLKRSYLI